MRDMSNNRNDRQKSAPISHTGDKYKDIREQNIEKKYLCLTVTGIVQGVGFRPFLHRLAEKYRIFGWVRNTSEGLEGFLSGETSDLDAFVRELRESPPPLSSVEQVRTAPADPEDFHSFTILDSRVSDGSTLISPDVSICPECAAELYDPSDRRYRYPFINCTNCGPRYTIIKALPYDRKGTVMDAFPMCAACEKEYRDIRNRRYHAQPDCCPKCGPQVFFLPAGEKTESNAGSAVPDMVTSADSAADPFRQAQQLLANGGILAVKGVGGIHLACNAMDPNAVRRLRQRKSRAEKPLAVMCGSLEAARRICRIAPGEEHLLTSPARPIVLLAKKDPDAFPDLSFSRRLGVMLPYSPLHMLLTDGIYGGPDTLVMTSANISGCPVLTENGEALAAMKDIADGFLLHNRDIRNRCDDSLVMEWKSHAYFFRRSRGYAPRPLRLASEADGIFAMGAEQKASFALGRDRDVFLSPHIGDLKNAETLTHYQQTLQTYTNLFRLSPSMYVCDLHPDYLSTREALRASSEHQVPVIQVQHHWAHMASCMTDNHLQGHCFGIIWDGTGLGTDGTIWGGEFLIGGYDSFRRAGSIRPIRLPGGDAAIREIGRIALALLADTGISDLAPVPLPPEKSRFLASMLRNGNESRASASFMPEASSIGRLFDGVCALILGRSQVDYEGEGAALVEALSPCETPDELKDTGEAAASMEDPAHGSDREPIESERTRSRQIGKIQTGNNQAKNTQAGNRQTGDLLRRLSYTRKYYIQETISGQPNVNGVTYVNGISQLRLFDTRPMIREILQDLEEGAAPGQIALRFMSTLCCMALDQCIALNSDRLPVVLSGGVFQNRFLLSGITSLLEESGYEVYIHRQVSPCDEGICLGQLAIAQTKRRKIDHVSGNANENQENRRTDR